MTEKYKETDLYQPVAEFLREKGFTVRGEVRGCDVAAIKDSSLVVVEMKLAFNMKLLMQAVDRLTLTDYVYIALPRPATNAKNGVKSMFWRDMLRILKRLEIGLLLVSLDSELKTVEPVLHPMAYVFRKNTQNRLKIITEIDGRVGDFSTGGSTRTKIITAYKEKSVHVACILKERHQASTEQLRMLGITQRELMLLRNNYYGWFERVEKGVYALSEEGRAFLETPDENLSKMVEYYCKRHFEK